METLTRANNSEVGTYLGYYNPNTGTIYPLDSTCTLPLNPFEESVRRFFFVSDYSLENKHVQVHVDIAGSKKFSYDVRVLVGEDNPGVSKFKAASNFDGVLYSQASKNYTNGIPIDIYLKSLSSDKMPVNLSITITTPPVRITSSDEVVGRFIFNTIGTSASTYPIDLVLLQDLSGSFSEDLVTIRGLVPSLVSSVRAIQPDTKFGVASFVDKPLDPFGSTGDHIYRIDLPLTTSEASLQETINGLVTYNGGDGPESQLEALQQIALTKDGLGYRPEAVNLVVLFTDYTYHKAGDNIYGTVNNNDTITSVMEDYPSVVSVRRLLEDYNIWPIFSVTTNVLTVYEGLVTELGRGSVVELTSNSSNLVSAVTTGISSADIKKIVLPLSGSVEDIPEGAIITLNLRDSANYTMSGTTLVNNDKTFSFNTVDFSSVSEGPVYITLTTTNIFGNEIIKNVTYLYAP